MKIAKKTFLAGLAVLPATTAMAWDLNLGKDKKIEFHGFASQGFLASTDYNYLGDNTTDGSFQFNEVGLNASFSPLNRTRITAQGFMFDLGDVNNNRPFLDYASIEYTFSDAVGVRAGRIRRPGGIYNHIQDVDLARTSVLLPQGVYDPRWRDFSTSIDGAVVFGSVPIGKAGDLAYEAYAGYMTLNDKGGVARSIQNSLPAVVGSYEGIDNSLITGAQLWWNTPVDGLRAGLSHAYVLDFTYKIGVNSPSPVTGVQTTTANIPAFQASLEYLWKSWTFQAEYYTYTLDGDSSWSNPLLGGPSHDRSTTDSWYVGASYRVNKLLELGTYYSEAYANVNDRSGENLANPSDAYQKDVALSARFDIKDWWIFKLEGHYYRGTSLLFDNKNNPNRDEDGWFMFAAKTTFSF